MVTTSWSDLDFLFILHTAFLHTYKTVIYTFRSPEMLAPARIPMADGKKIANILKKLPSGPLQSGNRFSKKISPTKTNCCQKIFVKQDTELALLNRAKKHESASSE